jgi:hypothetical protein
MMGLPMLVTPPGSELALPPEMGYPPGSTFRLTESLGTCMFVALASADTFSTPEPRTLILCWDSDIVHFLESRKMATQLHALQHIKSELVAGRPVLTVREVVEIWRGREAGLERVEVIVFKASDGWSFCGVDGTAVPETVELESCIVRLDGPTMAD